MNSQSTEHEQIRELLNENQRLLTENNYLLRRLTRWQRWSFIMKGLWLLLILGAPFVVYYWVLEPYFTSLGSSFSVFEAGLQEVPGWKQFYEAVGAGGARGE